MKNVPLLKVHQLHLDFIKDQKLTRVLNGLSFELHEKQSLVLLGESGSGKSVTLRALLRLYEERNIAISGEIIFNGKNVLELNKKELIDYRGKSVSMVFQESGAAFDPVYNIGYQIVEMIRAHESISYQDAKKRALDLLDMVKIPQAKQRFKAYPHELSGGMRQRAMIALALACHPKILLADEPTTALDATVQMQILLLLKELQKELNMALIFVTHDIGAATELADQIAVMYAGRIVEKAQLNTILASPLHPYTQGLFNSVVTFESKGKQLLAIPGAPPNVGEKIKGCSFAQRCSYVTQQCEFDVPNLLLLEKTQVACWNPLLKI
jgi:peptide/nickel transport system ATP-binding protein